MRRGAALAAAMAVLAAGLCACSVPGPARPETIDAFVPTAVRFVQDHRGLRFKRSVTVRHLSDRAFAALVVRLQQENRADVDRLGKVLRALGLLDPHVDAERAQEMLLGSGVVGFYAPSIGELVVRGDTATLAVQHVIVHELTHALQDQWFGLTTRSGGGNDDADIAYLALVEGDAVRVEAAYLASLSPQDRQALQAQRSAGRALPSAVPPVLVHRLLFPYSIGPQFAAAILQARAQQGLDDAFRNHPASSSQVLHPDRFLSGEAPAPLAAPAADGPVVDRGTLGELGLDLLFENLVSADDLTSVRAQAATTGWAGDRYIAWAQGGGFCVRDRLATRTAADQAALTAALETLAATRPGVTLDTTSQPVLTSCG